MVGNCSLRDGELISVIVQAARRTREAASSMGSRVLANADHRSLVSSAVLIGVLTMVAKVVALGRDVLIAGHFGTSDAADAFLVAWVLPGFVFSLLSSGFVGAIIPIQLETRKKHGEVRERAVVGEVLLISLVAYAAASIFLLAGRSLILPIVAQGYSDSKFAMAVQLSIIMLPALLIGGVTGIWSAILNTENKFGLGAAAPMIVPVVSALVLLANPHASIEWLAASFVIGTGLQGAIVYLGLAREGLSAALSWHGLLPETRAVLRQFGVLASNNAIFGALGVVDSAMAATLGPGSQATLNYAGKLIVPLLAVSSTALGTAVLPYFSRLVANEDWDGLRNTLRLCVRLIVAISVPATALLIVLSRPIVALLFQRGEFTASDSNAVARVMATYALLIPIETVAVLMWRVVVSLQVGRIVVLASIGIFAFNIVGDYVFKQFIGLEGIALASVFNQAFSLIFLCSLWNWLQRTRMTP
jgi:putative peptidoglycan lipid II flippase